MQSSKVAESIRDHAWLVIAIIVTVLAAGLVLYAFSSPDVVSVRQTRTDTVNASNGPGGCGFSSTTTSNQGYNLTVYLSSRSLKIGDSECIAAEIQDNSSVPLPANESASFSLTFTITDSAGHTVDKSVPCVPGGGAPGTNPAPTQGFECGEFWDPTTPLQPGTYHIIVAGSLSGYQISITVINEVDVTLSAG